MVAGGSGGEHGGMVDRRAVADRQDGIGDGGSVVAAWQEGSPPLRLSSRAGAVSRATAGGGYPST